MKLASQMPSSTSLMPSLLLASTVEMLTLLRWRQCRPQSVMTTPSAAPIWNVEMTIPDARPARRPPIRRSMRRHPVAGFALGGCDFRIRHQFGNLAAHRDGVAAPLEGSEVKPLMRSDQIDDAGASARPVKPALEQHIRNGGRRHRHGRIQIDRTLKHVGLPVYYCPALLPARGPCPVVKAPFPRCARCAAVDRL